MLWQWVLPCYFNSNVLLRALSWPHYWNGHFSRSSPPTGMGLLKVIWIKYRLCRYESCIKYSISYLSSSFQLCYSTAFLNLLRLLIYICILTKDHQGSHCAGTARTLQSPQCPAQCSPQLSLLGNLTFLLSLYKRWKQSLQDIDSSWLFGKINCTILPIQLFEMHFDFTSITVYILFHWYK